MNEKIKVGITGQSGFVGTHLSNTLRLKENITLIPFEDNYFSESEKLNQFVSECDCIVHLAALNRHVDPQVIYHTNVNLVISLIDACKRTNSKPHIIFSSSTQESLENLYGKSKKDGRLLLESWAKENGARFTGMIIPNVFGPYGSPYYNSVVATFCYQLTHNEIPKIQVDGLLKLIFIDDLVKEFYSAIISKNETDFLIAKNVTHNCEVKVTEILNILNQFKELYFEKGIIPKLKNKLEYNLFNTFLCFIHADKFPIYLNQKSENDVTELLNTECGGKLEILEIKADEIIEEYFSSRKMKRLILLGSADIEVWKAGTEKKEHYRAENGNVTLIDIPIWKNFLIRNSGNDVLKVLKWETAEMVLME